MKFITDYKEFTGKGNKSVCDFTSLIELSQKGDILRYLNSGTEAGIRCSLVHDYIDGETKSLDIWLYTDGEYKWTTEEIYHFEKYNMILDNEFLSKVLRAS